MRNFRVLTVFLVIILLFALIGLYTPAMATQKVLDSAILSMEYLEDPSGSLTFEDIQYGAGGARETGGAVEAGGAIFQRSEDLSLRFGQTKSVIWVRLKLDPAQLQSGSQYLCVNTPTVQDVTFFQPVKMATGVSYEASYGGWQYDGSETEGFVYPVFQVARAFQADEYAYMRLTSAFTQNYSIGMMNDRTLHQVQTETVWIFGLFYGLLLAMGINNLINFRTFKNKAQLYYVLYIGFILLYHGALLGVYRIFLGPLAETLISHVITIGMLTFLFAIQFFRTFLDTKNRFPTYERIAKGLMAILFVDILLMLTGFRYEASVASSLIGTSLAIIVLAGAIKAVRSGIREARYYLAGWSFMVAGLFLLLLRVWGGLPSNTFTWIAVLLSSSIEAILLSLALSVRIKVLQEEKRTAALLLRQAEEVSLYNQSAFLQAQIKPHFLYNSFNIIAALCRIDAEKARDLLLDLSNYLKHSFDFANLHQYTTLQEELEFVRAYVRIEQARFPDTIQVIYDLDETTDLSLPPLILQPLVENAIRHGLRKKQGAGTVTLRVVEQEEWFLIEIEDDGVGMEKRGTEGREENAPEETGHGVGLKNIERRLEMMYKTNLEIESSPGNGTKVTLRIPKDQEKERKNP